MKSVFPVFVLAGIVSCATPESATEQETSRPDLTDLEALYWSRVESSRMNFTQADVDFMTDMIVHHAQALIMSRLAPENEAGRSIQTLAARIINAQDDEIAAMQKWLRDRSQPVPEVHIDGLYLTVRMEEPESGEHGHGEGHMDHHGHHDSHDHPGDHHDMSRHHDMPGMLTQEQLNFLATLQGPDFDREFLELMIEHHEGAVYMVRELLKVEGAANDTEAFELASGIHAEQVTEIERMKLMLENMNNE